MGKSIVGLVNTWDEAEKVKQALIGQGFRREEINSGFDNPDGQHAKYPIGGDEYADPGARKGGKGAAMGMIIGGVIGAIAGFSLSLIPGFLDTIPAIGLILGALGAGIGAYTGSMAGGVKKMGSEKESAALQRKPASTGEVFIAVNARDNQAEQLAMKVLRDNGARDVKQHSRDFFRDVKAQGGKTNEKLVK
ncbi:MAG: hypothetical protein ACR2FI_06765 [Burkholderiales bacterium]|nr:hypothetical protein [Burkholderiales bacterium]MDQ3194821.1 hypothetical protein [Pseudomonadota bacterium]